MRSRFQVTPRRPYSLERTTARLARFREHVDLVEDGVFRRLTFVSSRPLLIQITQKGPPSKAILNVTLSGDAARTRAAKHAATEVMDRVLGVSSDVRPFIRAFRDDPLLGPWLRSHRGLRVAGRLDVWETLLQIVLSQQINLVLAHDMLSDLVVRYGRRAQFDGRRYYTFPAPSRFARLTENDLRAFRLSRAKASTLIGLAQAIRAGELSDEKLQGMGDEEAVEFLTSFKGVGRWTAEFTLLRGLSRLDVFPGGDLGVVKYFARDLLGHKSTASEDDMRAFAERWRPYRGLALIYAYAELHARTLKTSS